MSQIKQPAIQVVANEINSIDTESNIPAIKAMVDLDRRIRESILEKKYDKIKEQTIKQEEAENINADSIRKRYEQRIYRLKVYLRKELKDWLYTNLF